MADIYLEELENTKNNFNLDAILSFQLNHTIEIKLGKDNIYSCYIDGKEYGLALTPIGALIHAIKHYYTKNILQKSNSF